MELTVNEDKMKEIFREIMINMIHERRDFFYDIIVEALEDVGLANAIREGRKNKFVAEQRIMALLEG